MEPREKRRTAPSSETKDRVSAALLVGVCVCVKTRLLSAPCKKFNFPWFNGKSISWQTVKILTSKQKCAKEKIGETTHHFPFPAT